MLKKLNIVLVVEFILSIGHYLSEMEIIMFQSQLIMIISLSHGDSRSTGLEWRSLQGYLSLPHLYFAYCSNQAMENQFYSNIDTRALGINFQLDLQNSVVSLYLLLDYF